MILQTVPHKKLLYTVGEHDAKVGVSLGYDQPLKCTILELNRSKTYLQWSDNDLGTIGYLETRLSH